MPQISSVTFNGEIGRARFKRRRSGRDRDAVPDIRSFLPGLIRVESEPSRFIPNTPCWTWTGKLNDGGYGVHYAEGKNWLVHRLSFLVAHGRFEPGKRCVCHTCDHPSCCNPEHLFAGTDSENQLDRIKWSATLEAEEMAVIRSSPFSSGFLKQKHNLTQSQVDTIRRGRDADPRQA